MPFDPPRLAILFWLLVPLVCIAAILIMISANSRQQATQAPKVNTTRNRMTSVILFGLLCLIATPFLMIIVGGEITLIVVTVMSVLLLASLGVFKRRA